MILPMEADANAKLAAKTNETHNIAKEQHNKWQANPPPPNCTSEMLSKYINTYRLHINPYVEQPKSGSVLSNELLEIIKAHKLGAYVAPQKMKMTKDGEWSDDAKVEEYLIELIGYVHDPSLASGNTPTFSVVEKPTYDTRGPRQTTRQTTYREKGSGLSALGSLVSGYTAVAAIGSEVSTYFANVYVPPLVNFSNFLLSGQPNQTTIVDSCAIYKYSPLKLKIAQLTTAPAEYESPMQPCSTVDTCSGKSDIGTVLNTDVVGVATDDDGPSQDVAMKKPERPSWIPEENEEMRKLERYEAYNVSEDSLSTRKQIEQRPHERIDTLCVFKHKRDTDNNIIRSEVGKYLPNYENNQFDTHPHYADNATDKHEGAFSAALHTAGGGQVATIAVDTKVGGYTHDITRENVTEQLVEPASNSRYIDVLILFLVVSTAAAIIAPGSITALQTLAVANSGAALPVLNSMRYAIKGTARPNTTTANSRASPPTTRRSGRSASPCRPLRSSSSPPPPPAPRSSTTATCSPTTATCSPRWTCRRSSRRRCTSTTPAPSSSPRTPRRATARATCSAVSSRYASDSTTANSSPNRSPPRSTRPTCSPSRRSRRPPSPSLKRRPCTSSSPRSPSSTRSASSSAYTPCRPHTAPTKSRATRRSQRSDDGPSKPTRPSSTAQSDASKDHATKELGAQIATIAPHVPRQNGTMERQWRTARNDTSTTFTHSKYFFLQTVEIRNYMPWRFSRTMCNQKTFTGRVPRGTHLRALGALCFPKLISTPSKVHERSKPCIHLGRARNQFYDPKNRRIYITPHVIVLEDYFPGLIANGTDGIVVPPFDDSYDPTAPLIPPKANGETIQRDGDDDEYPGLLDKDDPTNDDSHANIQAQRPQQQPQQQQQLQQQQRQQQQQQQPCAPRNTGAAAARRNDSTPANPISGRTRASRAAAGVFFTAPPFVISPLSPIYMYAIYLCSGIVDKREGAFPAALHAAGGGQVATIAVDIKVGGYAHDITRENFTEQFVELASDSRCIGVLASFPSKTWSTARFNRPGPPLLRDIEQPEGVLDNKGNPPSAVLRPNAIVTNSTRILRAAHAHGAGPSSLGAPRADEGDKSPEQKTRPAYEAAHSLNDLASAPTIIPAQVLARAEEAYANEAINDPQIHEPLKIFGCEKIKTATVNAIRVVIGMHASPLSHCTNKVACDAAKPTVGRRTFKT